MLGSTEGGVKLAHHRARRAMEAYEGSRHPSIAEAKEQARTALFRFTEALLTGDLPRMEELLTADCRATSDGGGEFYAALNPILGAHNVARFYNGIFTKFGGVGTVRVIEVGGMPALFVSLPDRAEGHTEIDLSRVAREFVMQADVDAGGRITRLYSVLASRKLTHALGAQRGAATAPSDA